MAITLADFTKIWASTSPLTPYSFSDANYQQGWNFVGSTPPARQMWDSIQKQNDEKLKYIVDNFLPLSGGTMTGSVVFSSGNVKRETDDSALALYGGSEFGNGAVFQAFGKDHSTYAGWFSLRADDGANNKLLIGKPDGTLTWNSKNVIVSQTNIMAGTTSAVTVPANGTETVNVSFGTTFATAPKVVASCSISYQGTYAGIVSVSTTGCVIRFNNTSSTSRSLTADWIAISI